MPRLYLSDLKTDDITTADDLLQDIRAAGIGDEDRYSQILAAYLIGKAVANKEIRQKSDDEIKKLLDRVRSDGVVYQSKHRD